MSKGLAVAIDKWEIKFNMLLERWDSQQLKEFQQENGIYPGMEIAGKRIDESDAQIDYMLPVIKTRDYASYLVMKLISTGNTFRQVIKKAGVKPVEYSAITNRYIRYTYHFVSADGQHLHGSTMKKLAERITKAGICRITDKNARNVLNDKGGVYTYYGTYIGTFSKSTYARRLIMENRYHKQLTRSWWE